MTERSATKSPWATWSPWVSASSATRERSSIAAAFDGEEISSATVEAELRFADEMARSAFMTEYLSMLGPLLKKHGAKRGDRYRVAIAVYPEEEKTLE